MATLVGVLARSSVPCGFVIEGAGGEPAADLLGTAPSLHPKATTKKEELEATLLVFSEPCHIVCLFWHILLRDTAL